MEAEALRVIVAENRQLEQNLTKGNEQYTFDLRKSLKAANLSEEEPALALHGILPELIAGQKTGKTARQLFGTVLERTEVVLNKPAEVREPAGRMIWLGNTLLLLGLLTIMLAAMSLFSKGTAQPLGLTTYILGAMTGGYVFYLMYKYIYRLDRQGGDKSKRPGWLKTTAILSSGTFLWIAVFVGSVMLSPVINLILDPVITLVIGALALVARYFFKKKYNVQGSFMIRQ